MLLDCRLEKRVEDAQSQTSREGGQTDRDGWGGYSKEPGGQREQRQRRYRNEEWPAWSYSE